MTALARVGAQVPRLALVPPAATRAAAADAIEMADIAGLVLDPWQRLVLENGLGETAAGKWSAFESVLIVPRRNGKSALLQAMILAGLYVWGERTIIYSAHRFDTAQETFAELRALIEGCDELADEVRKIYTANGKEAVILKNGCRVKFMARERGAGRGFSGDRVIFDEAFKLSPQSLGALIPTMASRSMLADSNPQIWYASSAPMATSAVLHSLRERAADGSPRLAFAEWSAEESAANDDRDAWYEANPALGIRISEEFVSDELLALSHVPEEFRRERLGIPDKPAGGAGPPAIPDDHWSAALDEEYSMGAGAVAFGVDVAPDAAWASIVAVQRRPDGSMHLEVIDHEPGADWLEERLAARVKRARPIALGWDAGGPTSAYSPEIERCLGPRCKAVKLRGNEWQAACASFLADLKDRKIRHGGDALLDAAVGGAVRKTVGSGWIWDRHGVDISPLAAVTAALRAYDLNRPRRSAYEDDDE